MMDFPDMGKDWDSRFMGDFPRKKYEASCKGYVGKVRKEFSIQIKSMQELKTGKHLP